VIQASSGFEVIEALEKNKDGGKPVDLVLLDLQMPYCSGEETLKQIETFVPYPWIVLMTGNLMFERNQEIEIPRYSGILVKPFDRNTLLKTVSGILPDNQTCRNNFQLSSRL